MNVLLQLIMQCFGTPATHQLLDSNGEPEGECYVDNCTLDLEDSSRLLIEIDGKFFYVTIEELT